MTDEIKTRINVEADEAVRTADRFADSTKRIGDETEETGKKADGFGGVTEKMTGAMMGFAASLTGAFGVNALLEVYRKNIEVATQAMEQNIKAVREFAQARLDLVALSGVETPEQLQSIDRLATLSGRSPSEVARFQTLLTSQLASATPAQKDDIANLTAIKGQQSEASLAELAAPLITIFRSTQDARSASNIFEEAIVQAGVPDPAQLGPLIGQFAGPGQSLGKLSAGQAVGVVAAATSLGLAPEVAVTGFASTQTRLFGKSTPAIKDIIKRVGIRTDNFENALRDIVDAFQAGKLNEADLEELGGAEGLRVLATLAKPENENAFFAGVDAVEAAENREGLAVADKSKGIFESSNLQLFNLQAKQAEAGKAFAEGTDEFSAAVGATRAVLDREATKLFLSGTIDADDREDMLERFDDNIAAGYSIGSAFHQSGVEANDYRPFGLSFGHEPRVISSKFIADTLRDMGINFDAKRGGQITINNNPIINSKDPARADDERRNQE